MRCSVRHHPSTADPLPDARRTSSDHPQAVRLRRLSLIALVAVGVISLADVGEFLSPPWLTMNDFTPDYVSAREWFQGGRPYDPVPRLIEEHLGPDAPHLWDGVPDQRNAHPPSLLVLIAPLALLPYDVARASWLFLSAGGYVAATALFARANGFRRSTALALGVGILALPAVRADLRFGQSSALLLVLLVWGSLALRRGDDVHGGAVLGVATALKVFPGFLILPLLFMRRVRAAGSMVGAAAIVSIAGALALGIGSTTVFLSSSGDNARFWAGAPFNRSLVSLPFHWLQPNVWFDGVDAPVLASALAGILLAVLVGIAFVGRGRLTGDRVWDALPVMLLAAPLSWEHYFPLLIPVGILTIVRLRDGAMDLPAGRIALAAVTVVLLCDTLATAILDVTGVAAISTPGFLVGWAIPLYALVILAALSMRGRELGRA